MLAVERRKKISNIIVDRKSVTVIDLAHYFEVSGETIRNDLEKLEKQGVLVRTYGGATLVQSSAKEEMTLKEREVINAEGKRRIGEFAASLVRDGETIFLDASTSSLQVARNLKGKRHITVITNSQRVVNELSGDENIHLVCTGGQLRTHNMSYVGRVAEENIKNHYYANKCFFSCRGINLGRGLMDSNEQEAEIKKAMMKYSESSIFLCDQSKLGILGVPMVGRLEDLDVLITDIQLDEQWSRAMNDKEIEVHSVL